MSGSIGTSIYGPGTNALAMPGITGAPTTNALAPQQPANTAPFQFDPVAAQQWIAQQMQQQANFPATAPGTFDDQAGLRGMLEQLNANPTSATPGQPPPMQTTSPVLAAYGPAMATMSQLTGAPIGGVQNYPGAASGQGLVQWLGQQFDQGPNPGGGGTG